jgi:hypothetical protein
MPRKVTLVQMFVASPSDVQQERDLLESLIAELNKNWSRNSGVIFELVRWETHVRPGFGNDPQAVINEQIGDNYDVFIGVLWGCFGTTTPRAMSGTFEEFERAYKRFQSTGAPEIMFYFKDAPIAPSKIDPAQLQQVQSFRASLPEKGGLYATFEDESGFQTSLRAHLAALAQKFSTADTITSATDIAPVELACAESSNLDTDELGYLDYVELYESRMADLTATLTVISGATVRVGQQMNQRTKEIVDLQGKRPDTATARRLVKRTADDMDAYSNVLAKQLPLMTSCRVAALQALTRALTLYQEFGNTGKSDLQSLRTSLADLLSPAGDSRKSLARFRDSVSGLPRMTSDLNRAKRAVLEQLDIMLGEIDGIRHNIDNILKSIDTILEG